MATVTIICKEKKINRNGLAPVFVQLIKNGKSTLFGTGIKIDVKDWDRQKQRVKPSHPNSSRTNNILNQKRIEVESQALKDLDEKTNLTSKQIKEALMGRNLVKADFFKQAELILRGYLINNQITNHDKNKSIVNKLKGYLGHDYMPLQDMNREFMTGYEQYLRTKLKNGSNTIINSLKFFKMVIRESMKDGLIQQNPLQDFSIRSEPVTRVYLTPSELDLFEAAKTEEFEKQNIHKDLFIFLARSGGMRISDVLLFRWDNLDGDRIHFRILKTGKQVTYKLTAKGTEIVEKYRRLNLSPRFVFPLLPDKIDLNDRRELDRAINCQTALVNKSLRSIAKKAGIEKRLSAHKSRHSWAMYALAEDVSLKALSQILGHSSVRETEVYARMTGEGLDQVMARL